jgi:WD40 repeat protein
MSQQSLTKIISEMFAISLCRLIARIRFDVEHSRHPNYLENMKNLENLELTLKYILQILAMSGLTGFLVKRIFAGARGGINVIPQSVLRRLMMQMQMQIISYHHEPPTKFSIQPSGLGIVLSHPRVFKYDNLHNTLIMGDESGKIIIVVPDGRRITHKMTGGCITDISMPSANMVIVCNGTNHAHIFVIENCELSLVYKLGHENDVTSACGDLSSGLIATGSRDKSYKIWKMTEDGPVCLQKLPTNQNSRVTKVLITCVSSAHVIAYSDNYVKVYLILISKDGKEVLSKKCLFAQNEGDVRIAFHPNPKKKILISGGLNGQIIVWRFQITSSNEILTENLIIELPDLEGYWTCSISFHDTLPIVLFCFADINCEKRPNRTMAVVFSNGFEKVLSIMNLREGSPNGGSARAVFYRNNVLISDYYIQAIMQLVKQ